MQSDSTNSPVRRTCIRLLTKHEIKELINLACIVSTLSKLVFGVRLPKTKSTVILVMEMGTWPKQRNSFLIRRNTSSEETFFSFNTHHTSDLGTTTSLGFVHPVLGPQHPHRSVSCVIQF